MFHCQNKPFSVPRSLASVVRPSCLGDPALPAHPWTATGHGLFPRPYDTRRCLQFAATFRIPKHLRALRYLKNALRPICGASCSWACDVRSRDLRHHPGSDCACAERRGDRPRAQSDARERQGRSPVYAAVANHAEASRLGLHLTRHKLLSPADRSRVRGLIMAKRPAALCSTTKSK
jgi:hypothetical protein